MKRGFGSDNHASVHPKLMAAISAHNFEHAPSYGTDELSLETQKLFSKLFGTPTEAHFVFNGTGANVCALRALAQPWHSVLCSDVAHIHVDECGAPEAIGGFKLLTIPSQHGKMQPQDVEASLIRKGDQHYSQAKVLSITQPTELGTTYSLTELRDLVAVAKKHQLYVHIDGARIANAVVFAKSSFAEMFTQMGVDVVSFGGTKNGFMMGEAVVFLNPSLAKDFKYIRKQSLQLPSKSRFIAAQFAAYLQDNLWQEIASHSLQMANLLYQAVREIPQVQVSAPPQSNAVFATIPQAWVKTLREHYFFYVWDEKTFECRWMTSWDTTPEDIQGFAQTLSQLSTQTV